MSSWLSKDGHGAIKLFLKTPIVIVSFALGCLIRDWCLKGRQRSLGSSALVITLNSPQKFREFLEGSNLISKLQAKHDLLKRTLGEGKGSETHIVLAYFLSGSPVCPSVS